MSSDPAQKLLAIDVGGTFTDAVVWDGSAIRTGKLSSTPQDQGLAVTAAATAMASDTDLVLHGTTLATYALLERRGAKTALVTTEGFEDVIEIARQDRPSRYDSFAARPTPLVAPADRHGVPRGEAGAPHIGGDIEAVAISLLYGYQDAETESAIATELRCSRPALTIARSSEVAPEFREYERTFTTVLNAYLQPVVEQYSRLVAWVANRAHHADVEGEAPGSMPAHAATLDQEGCRIAPMISWRNGAWIDDFSGPFLDATRTPDERLGDLSAQVGANAAGARRLGELISASGSGGFHTTAHALLDYGERRMWWRLGFAVTTSIAIHRGSDPGRPVT